MRKRTVIAVVSMLLVLAAGLCACDSSIFHKRSGSDSTYDFMVTLIGSDLDTAVASLEEYMDIPLQDNGTYYGGAYSFNIDFSIGNVEFDTLNIQLYEDGTVYYIILLQSEAYANDPDSINDYLNQFDEINTDLHDRYGEPVIEIPLHDTREGQSNFERYGYSTQDCIIEIEYMFGGNVSDFSLTCRKK